LLSVFVEGGEKFQQIDRDLCSRQAKSSGDLLGVRPAWMTDGDVTSLRVEDSDCGTPRGEIILDAFYHLPQRVP
jgi:hypothetical protein